MVERFTREEEELLDEAHIKEIWNELHERFGFNLKEWKKKFDQYVIKQTRETSVMSCFYRFGHDYINPILNDILCRQRLYPTFTNLVKFVISKSDYKPAKNKVRR
jgi:hypothetical protein